jgi:PTH1 family peptidyl-tRNA hydrolase
MNLIRLIVGLGNPGPDYSHTRHNAGFWFIDELVTKYNANLNNESKFFGIVGRFNFKNRDVYLLKPQTYMNLSGKSVLAVANFYKILPSEILVVHDELDFAPGIARFKQGGGNGGHNGLKDIDRCLGKDYLRLRIGIGHPGDRNKVADYVLKKPQLDEKIAIDNSLDKSISVADLLLSGEISSATKILHSS